MNRQNTAVLLLTALFFVGGATALVQSHPISEIVVDTTNLVDNLNADLLDGKEGSYYKDTNAQTICPDGKVLTGDGKCKEGVTDSKINLTKYTNVKKTCGGYSGCAGDHRSVSCDSSDHALIRKSKYTVDDKGGCTYWQCVSKAVCVKGELK